MFTGIIQHIGTVESIVKRDNYLAIEISSPLASDIADGDSVACDGVCLTVVSHGNTSFAVDVSQETIARTTASQWHKGSHVNLESALRIGDRLGGHFVTGHIDGKGVVAKREAIGQSLLLEIRFDNEFTPFVIDKGSVAIDGVSLTVNSCGDGWLSVNLIPFTCEQTTLPSQSVGGEVNLEFDMIGKYVMSAANKHKNLPLTRELLQKAGW